MLAEAAASFFPGSMLTLWPSPALRLGVGLLQG